MILRKKHITRSIYRKVGAFLIPKFESNFYMSILSGLFRSIDNKDNLWEYFGKSIKKKSRLACFLFYYPSRNFIISSSSSRRIRGYPAFTKSLAFCSLLPASSPIITTAVFLLTLFDNFPPFASIIS